MSDEALHLTTGDAILGAFQAAHSNMNPNVYEIVTKALAKARSEALDEVALIVGKQIGDEGGQHYRCGGCGLCTVRGKIQTLASEAARG